MNTTLPNGAGYEDRWISCTPTAIEIRGYYFPWGTKRVGYDAVQSVRRVSMGALTGRARIWGTANLRYWAHLDPRRPRKKTALILDLGHPVSPFITPDDVGVAEAIICERAHIAPAQASERGPVIC
jgi:hypothetical protein